MDVAVALIFVFLFYSNPAIAIMAEWWTGIIQLPPGRPKLKEPLEGHDQGDLMVPPCCIPFCFIQGRYHITAYPDQSKKHQEERAKLQTNFDERVSELQNNLQAQRRQAHDMVNEARVSAEATIGEERKRAENCLK